VQVVLGRREYFGSLIANVDKMGYKRQVSCSFTDFVPAARIVMDSDLPLLTVRGLFAEDNGGKRYLEIVFA